MNPFKMFPHVLVNKPKKTKVTQTMATDDQITGRVVFKELVYDDNGNVVSCNFDWVGGNTIGVSLSILWKTDPKIMRKDGLYLYFGDQYCAKIIDYTDNCALAERIY